MRREDLKRVNVDDAEQVFCKLVNMLTFKDAGRIVDSCVR